MKPVPDYNVYICAAGHSGSTLLDLVLGSHSQAVSLGEITQLPKNYALDTQCTCGASVRQCLFWQRVLHCVGERLNINVAKNPYSLDLGFIDARVVIDGAKQTKWYNVKRKLVTGATYIHWRYGIMGLSLFAKRYMRAMRNNAVLYDAVREVTGARIVIDSTKHYMKAVGIYKCAPENTRIILLTRDGRAVFNSNLRRKFGRKRSLESWYQHFSRALPLFKQQLPDDAVIRVSYEELCHSPRATISRLCRFIGIDFEQAMLDFSNGEHHIANGNDMRFGSTSEIRLDERWRNELRQDDADYFRRRACWLNQQLGYKD